MWWNKWTGDQAIRGLKRFWLLNTYLAISGKNWLKTDINHFWIKIYLWTELEGNPSDWMAFSIFVLALFFSPIHVFSFLLSRWFSLPSTLFLSYCCCKRPLWFLPHQRTIDAKWCIMLMSLVNPLISVLLKKKRTEKGQYWNKNLSRACRHPAK